MTAPGTTGTTGTPRGGVRTVHVVTLTVAALLLLGSVIFVLVATSDKNSAADDRVAAKQALHDQRAATADAQDQLIAAESAKQATGELFGSLIGQIRTLGDISQQGLDAARTTQRIGASDTMSVADYNAAVAHQNELADQYNAATQVIRDKIKSVVRDLAAQSG